MKTVASLAALLAGIWGGSTRLAPGAPRRLIGLLSLYFLTPTALVSMSRFRLPLIPLAIVLGAGLLTARPATQPEIPRASLRRARLAAAIATVLLLFLWWVDLPEVLAVLEIALA